MSDYWTADRTASVQGTIALDKLTITLSSCRFYIPGLNRSKTRISIRFYGLHSRCSRVCFEDTLRNRLPWHMPNVEILHVFKGRIFNLSKGISFLLAILLAYN